MVFRADRSTFDEINTLRPLKPQELEAMLKRLGAHGAAPPHELRRMITETLGTHH